MKKVFFIVMIVMISSCSNDDDNQSNPNLPGVNVNFSINLNLPQYNNLDFPNGVFVDRTDGRGIRGVIIYNQNNEQFFAYELSDPNIPPSDCSALIVEGTRASSGCGNENIYEISSFGQQVRGEGGLPLQPYRVTKDGSVLNITN